MIPDRRYLEVLVAVDNPLLFVIGNFVFVFHRSLVERHMKKLVYRRNFFRYFHTLIPVMVLE